MKPIISLYALTASSLLAWNCGCTALPSHQSASQPAVRSDPPSPPARPQNVLVLSSGGSYGAFQAGVLTGWTAAGNRPEFEVVTGVSTGALIAPLAFLGCDYDTELERLYTSVRTDDIYRPRSLTAILRSDAVADSEPLRRLIAEVCTPEIIDAVAAAHRAGRRLYVGTTNLDTNQLIVWDLGAIAATNESGRVHLFRQVLLASAAVPGLLPPVPITIERGGQLCQQLHADGGVAATLFVEEYMLRGTATNHTPPTVHVLIAGKLDREATPVQPQLFSVVGAAFAGVLNTRRSGDILRCQVVARRVGGDVRVASVPREDPIKLDTMTFEPKKMRALYQTGQKTAAAGRWEQLNLDEGFSTRLPYTGTRGP